MMTEMNLSSREMGRRIMRPDEVLTMPRDQAWLFVKGLRPIRITLVHYSRVTPWRDIVGENPIEGPIDRTSKPAFRLHYPERKTP